MGCRLHAALLAGALAGMVPAAVTAADLDTWDRRSSPRAESPYDDPRYRYLYGDPAPPSHTRREPDDDDDRPPRSYKDAPTYRDDHAVPPRHVEPRYAEPPRHAEVPSCLSRREVRERLHHGGWHGFHDIELRHRVAYVRAFRPSGRLFDLEVDRCSGRILSARELDAPPRPYAWRGQPPPWRY